MGITKEIVHLKNSVERFNPQTGGADREAKKRRNEILTSESQLGQISGRRYYISPNGDDTASGTSPQTAWRTLEGYNVRKKELVAGDAVLFERGYIFRGFIELVSGVSYSVYGKGLKPAIYGSTRNFNDLDDWIETEIDNVWACCDRMPYDVGVIVFNHGERIGIKKINDISEIKEELDFYHDPKTATLYIYSQKNPAEFFYDIEICDGKHNIIQGKADCTDVTIDNLTIKYGGGHGIHFTSGARNIRISNCEIGWIGGCFLSGKTRFGNGIELWDECHNILIENNWVYQIYDAGITHQGGITPNGYEQSDIIYRNNLVEYCVYAFELFAGEPKHNRMHNITYTDNILRFSGYGWGLVRPNPQKVSLICAWGGNDGFDLSQFKITHNIFDVSDNYMFVQYYNADMPYDYIENTYYQRKGLVADWEFGKQLKAETQQEFEESVNLIDPAPLKVKLIK